jgi:hypothetical protein
MFELFWELHQQRRIGEAQSAAQNSETKARDVENEVERLRQSIEKLSLVNAAMWSLLQEKTGVKNEQLIDRMQQIDLMDGAADGRISQTRPAACPSCKRPMSRTHERCMYCGAYSAVGRNVFDVT